MTVPDRTTFVSAYAGQAPWDIGRPLKAFLDVADRITGSILDAGCGKGENALFFVGRGHKVPGIDFLPEPIERARRKAAERGLMSRRDLINRSRSPSSSAMRTECSRSHP